MMLCTWCSIACLIFTVIFVFSAWWQDLEGEWHGHERSDSWRGRPVPSFSPGSDQPDCTVQKRRIRPDRIATARRFFLHQVSFLFQNLAKINCSLGVHRSFSIMNFFVLGVLYWVLFLFQNFGAFLTIITLRQIVVSSLWLMMSLKKVPHYGGHAFFTVHHCATEIKAVSHKALCFQTYLHTLPSVV